MRLDTAPLTRTARRRPASLAILSLGLALAAVTAGPAAAPREDQGLQLGCANDYFRLCAGVDPNSQDADRCMMRNRKRLSPECRTAIGDYDKRTGSKSLSDD